MTEQLHSQPHRRLNILTGEWVLVSPHRNQRPWQGKQEVVTPASRPEYDPECYLCPGNTRAGGQKNPNYTEPFSFQNDFAALLPQEDRRSESDGLLVAQTETGLCKVICFSPDHSLTLPDMSVEDVTKVIQKWKSEYLELGSRKDINYVQIFENKGEIMGCSNPHPHGQIWAQFSIPDELEKKSKHFKVYWEQKRSGLLQDYLHQELQLKERIVLQNENFVALVPYWAVWPFETMIIPRKQHPNIGTLDSEEEVSFASILKELTQKYDRLFQTSFPYSSGIHQSPTDGQDYPEWHFHMSFYPPLLRSSTVRKFMVGYEMFAGPQRDITAEEAAKRLREA